MKLTENEQTNGNEIDIYDFQIDDDNISNEKTEPELVREIEDLYIEYSLPYGWKKKGHKRQNEEGGKIRWDFYVISPAGKKLRSNVEINRYLEANPGVKCDRNITNTKFINSSKGVPNKINENKNQTEIIPTEISRDNNKKSSVILHQNYTDNHDKENKKKANQESTISLKKINKNDLNDVRNMVLPNSKKPGFSVKVAEYLDWKKGKIRAVADRQISKNDTNSIGDKPQKFPIETQESEIPITNSESTNLENDQSKIDPQTSNIIDQNPITKSIRDSKTQKTPNKISPEISKDSVDYLNWKKEQKKLAEIKKNVPNQTSENKTTNDPKIFSDRIEQTPVKSKQTPSNGKQTPSKSKQTPSKSKQTPAKKKDLFPYKCRQCTEAFGSIDEIMKHCQTVHEEKKQEEETSNVHNKHEQTNNVHENDEQTNNVHEEKEPEEETTYSSWFAQHYQKKIVREGKNWKEVHELKKPEKSSEPPALKKGLEENSVRNFESHHDSDSNQTTLKDTNREKEVRKMQTEINIKAEIGIDSDDEIRVVGCVSKSKVIDFVYLKFKNHTVSFFYEFLFYDAITAF